MPPRTRLSSSGSSSPTTTLSLQPYEGPMLASEEEELGPAVEGGGLWLQEYGAVLEVHESVAVPGGLGLFIRLEQTGDVSQTLLPAGAPICGYAEGRLLSHQDYDPKGQDRTVIFGFSSLDTPVFYERQLRPFQEVLSSLSSPRVHGHDVTYDEEGRPISIRRHEKSKDPVYFVPNPPPPKGTPISSVYIGHYANDLAVATIATVLASNHGSTGEAPTAARYEQASSFLNLLGLVWRVEWSEEQGAVVPSRPISVVCQDTLLTNFRLMEIGCRYGWSGYWEKMVVKPS